jgi:anthrone oxygenase-like protein
MVDLLQVLGLILVVLAMVPALAHALELPGKLRLTKEAYFAVQPIYYPGFTIAGVSEPVAIISTIVLLVLTPRGTADFWLTLVALLGLVAMHAVYWIFTHPVNNFWLQGEKLSGLGSGFFSWGSASKQDRQSNTPVDWTQLRDRWEYSHVARAGLVFLSFIALVNAISSASDT